MSPAIASETEVGIANLPNQRHKIVSSKGVKFTLMVVGESGLGKTTFINTLLTTTIKDYKNPNQRHEKHLLKTVEIEVTRAELEERNFPVRLTLVDTPGFGDFVDKKDIWVPIVEYIDNQYENRLRQERQPDRKKVEDDRVHACLYFIRPSGRNLSFHDVEAMKHLSKRVNLIPVIAKADTMVPEDLAAFKKRIRTVMEQQGIRSFRIPGNVDNDEAQGKQTSELMDAVPFAIVSSEQDVVNAAGETVKGRQYPWGVVEVENEEHSDFKKLRNLLVRTHMIDLISSTKEVHYERFRQTRMQSQGETDGLPRTSPSTGAGSSAKLSEQAMSVEEDNIRKRFTEQVKAAEARFKAWEQKLFAERDRLNKDLETEHNRVRLLQEEIEQLTNARHK